MTAPEVRELVGDELAGWDAAAVEAPGGHVFQSRAWAEHRVARGWRPRFLAAGDRHAMVLAREWAILPGGSAYIPRGPVGPAVPWSVAGAPAATGAGRTTGEALAAITARLAADGVDVLAADPEVAADDGAYAAAVSAAGFRPIPEIQPSRHRMGLAIAGADEQAVLGGIAKATRQRIRRAERDGVVVLRWDSASGDAEGFVRATEPDAAAFERFYGLLRETGDRLGFGFAGPAELTAWWRRALAAGHLVYLEAREGAPDGDVLGGLVLYRHGVRLSTAHSADRAGRRRDHPGTMHLLRWRAIQLAMAEGRSEMDLGGVDLPGARRVPVEGEATFGLYEHKRSFGAQWVALAGAQECVTRGWRYAAGRATTKLVAVMGGRRARG